MSETRKVVVNVPGRPKGEKVEVLYLGLFENGATHDLSDEQVTTYESVSGNSFPESGYVFAGEPKGDAQKKAFEANAKSKVSTVSKPFEPSEVPVTQIEGKSTTQVDPVETGETEEKK